VSESTYDFHEPQPVQKCACGLDCDWCIAANQSRRAFPNARVPPKHDGTEDHSCTRCFLKKAMEKGQVIECNLRNDR